MLPLILTARLDRGAQFFFNGLRQRHFPRERNFVAAHLTLFHALPATGLQLIQSQLAPLTQHESIMPGVASKLHSLGNGVAFEIQCPQLVSLRNTLADLWQIQLTPQDCQPFRPHITIQNKVKSVTAQALLQQLQRDFTPVPIMFEGVDLWFYQSGPWDLAATFPFSSNDQTL